MNWGLTRGVFAPLFGAVGLGVEAGVGVGVGVLGDGIGAGLFSLCGLLPFWRMEKQWVFGMGFWGAGFGVAGGGSICDWKALECLAVGDIFCVEATGAELGVERGTAEAERGGAEVGLGAWDAKPLGGAV